jgi:hypothetical protein
LLELDLLIEFMTEWNCDLNCDSGRFHIIDQLESEGSFPDGIIPSEPNLVFFLK